MADYQTQFLNQMYPYANRVAKATGTDPKLILARWAGETGWGQRVLKGTFNLGNVMETRSGVDAVSAYDNGNLRRFRKFNSWDDYANYEIGLLQRRYGNALNTNDPMKHFTALKAGGYAEAPNYASHMGQDMYKSVLRRMGGVDTSRVATGNEKLGEVTGHVGTDFAGVAPAAVEQAKLELPKQEKPFVDKPIAFDKLFGPTTTSQVGGIMANKIGKLSDMKY